MQSDEVVPSKELGTAILDRRPIDPADLGKPKAKSAAANPEEKSADESAPKIGEGNLVSLRDHCVLGKYFKMLKAGIPYASVRARVEQAGLDPTILDRDPSEEVPENFGVPVEPTAADADKTAAAKKDGGEMVAVKDHPLYSKYLRMLKVGLPPGAVRSKMELDNVDPSILDKDPDELVPLEVKAADEVEMVALKDHPSYGKYLKMLKVGLPLPAAKQKMQDDGFDPSILDLKPTDMVPVDTTVRKPPEPKKAISFKGRGKHSPVAKIRKKKLHWKALDASKVGADSLWADEDEDDFQLDDEEFNQLFVEK